jgi:myo-inositol-1(or 4)-monophosphatase
MVTPLEFTEIVAQQAGELLTKRFTPFGTKATMKADNSLVTQADLDADALIHSAIRQQFPDDFILSEENNSMGGDVERPTWVVDPLDGTTNFSLGLPIWGVSIARLVNGFPQTATLYFPILDELFSAEAGGGAYLNRVRLETSDRTKSQNVSFFACCSRTFRQYKINLPYKARILGAAAYNICCVAKNTALICMEISPKIWDLAAGWLLVKEAGGEIELLEGESPFPLKPKLDYKSTNFPLAAAKDTEVLQFLRKNIQKR